MDEREVNRFGNVFDVDLSCDPPKKSLSAKGLTEEREIYTSRYLVEDSSGDLLQIGRFSPCEEEKDMCVDDEMLIMRWDQKGGSRLKSSGEHCHFCGY